MTRANKRRENNGLGHVWFLEILRENVRERKQRGKVKERKKVEKKKDLKLINYFYMPLQIQFIFLFFLLYLD